MTQPENSPSGAPYPGDLRTYLAQRAADAARHQEEVVGAATAAQVEKEQVALGGLAAQAEDARHLPKQGRDELGPLWPGRT